MLTWESRKRLIGIDMHPMSECFSMIFLRNAFPLEHAEDTGRITMPTPPGWSMPNRERVKSSSDESSASREYGGLMQPTSGLSTSGTACWSAPSFTALVRASSRFTRSFFTIRAVPASGVSVFPSAVVTVRSFSKLEQQYRCDFPSPWNRMFA